MRDISDPYIGLDFPKEFYPISEAPKDGSLLVCLGRHKTDNLGMWKIGQPWCSILKYRDNLGWVFQEGEPCWSDPEYFIPLNSIIAVVPELNNDVRLFP